MKTIVLARHGKPEWSDSSLISRRELGEWVQGRNAAPIDPGHPPSPELRRIARTAKGFAEARRRAQKAAEMLIAIAPDQGTLLLVGQGIMNGLIGLRLRTMGWSGPHLRPRRLWAYGVYRMPASGGEKWAPCHARER